MKLDVQTTAQAAAMEKRLQRRVDELEAVVRDLGRSIEVVRGTASTAHAVASAQAIHHNRMGH